MGRKKKYFTEEERKAAHRERVRKWQKENPDYMKEWYKKNPDYMKEWYKKNPDKAKKWYEENKDDFNAYYKEWIKEKRKKDPILARAQNICDSYRTCDKKYNRGECTITAQWIVDNIFTKPCFYCDKTGWEIMGCDRIYNDLPHTPENVVCCCEECNVRRGRKGFVEFLKEIGRLDKLKELKDKVIITDEVLID